MAPLARENPMSDMTVEYKRFPITVEMYYRMGENGILTENARFASAGWQATNIS